MNRITTGYEAEFDFPPRTMPPSRPYLLASVPRSGSTYVSHLLWQSGCLGAPLEYLNFEPTGPSGFASDSPAAQSTVWHNALTRRTSPNGVFGLKAFPLQLDALQSANPALLVQVMRTLFPAKQTPKVVQLRRRDRTAHAISYARATLSGIWRSEQEAGGRPEPDYSERAMINAGHILEQQECIWEDMYRDLRITPLVIWYEDVLVNPPATAAAVADYLDVRLDPAAKVDIPEIKQQSQAGAKAWAAAHTGQGR